MCTFEKVKSAVSEEKLPLKVGLCSESHSKGENVSWGWAESSAADVSKSPCEQIQLSHVVV